MPHPPNSHAGKRRGSVASLWLSIAVIVLGLAGAGLWGTTQVLDIIDHVNDFPRMSIPGQTAVSVAEPGTRIIYYLASDVDSPPRLTLSVVAPDGSSLPVREYEFDLRYEVAGSRIGRAIAQFDAGQPGKYLVSVKGEADAGSELAIGDTSGWGLVSRLLGPIVLGAITFMGGLALMIWGILRHRRVPDAPPQPTPGSTSHP